MNERIEGTTARAEYAVRNITGPSPMIYITVDLERLALNMARAARSNRNRQANLAGGAVVVDARLRVPGKKP